MPSSLQTRRLPMKVLNTPAKWSHSPVIWNLTHKRAFWKRSVRYSVNGYQVLGTKYLVWILAPSVDYQAYGTKVLGRICHSIYPWYQVCKRVCHIIQLKIMLGFGARCVFAPWSQRTIIPKSAPRSLILFGTSPPCRGFFGAFKVFFSRGPSSALSLF